MKPELPERVWLIHSESGIIWGPAEMSEDRAMLRCSHGDRAFPYVPASLLEPLRMENKALKQLVLDRIKRDTLSAEMAGSLLGILQFHDLPINAQGAIRELLDKWKALNDADAIRAALSPEEGGSRG